MRESLFESEEERSFYWGITPNKSESLLKSDLLLKEGFRSYFEVYFIFLNKLLNFAITLGYDLTK